MAPREVPKPATALKAQRVVKTVGAKTRSSTASPATVKKALSSTKKTIEKVPLKMSNTTQEPQQPRQRTNTVPKIGTPKPKEQKPPLTPGNITKSAKKSAYKRRPAHSGVPVPEKLKQLMQRLRNREIDDL